MTGAGAPPGAWSSAPAICCRRPRGALVGEGSAASSSDDSSGDSPPLLGSESPESDAEEDVEEDEEGSGPPGGDLGRLDPTPEVDAIHASQWGGSWQERAAPYEWNRRVLAAAISPKGQEGAEQPVGHMPAAAGQGIRMGRECGSDLDLLVAIDHGPGHGGHWQCET